MPAATEMVTIPTRGGNIRSYLSLPTGTGKFPAIVVVHEAYGLNDDIKGIADRFADEGYVALAVDLFAGRSRVVCMARFIGGAFLNSLDHGGIHDLRSALNFLENHPTVDTNKLGAIGFCMGGNLAICWACTDPRLRVVAPFYGMAPRPIEALARSCPVVGSYPENDFSAGVGRKLDQKLDEYKIPHDIKIYPGARHSFFNHGRNHDEEAAQDAWRRTLAFFKEQFGIN
jgi:carboxymethylenebutenolidase